MRKQDEWRVRDDTRAGKQNAWASAHGGPVIVQELDDDGVRDLNRLAHILAVMLARRRVPSANENGKERLYWAVSLMLGCPQDVAVQLVEALVLRRQLVLCVDRSGCEFWRIVAPPPAC